VRVGAVLASLAACFSLESFVPHLGPIFLSPVVLSAFWFGRVGGTATAAAASTLLLMAVIVSDDLQGWVLIFSVPAFFLVGQLLGRHVEQRRAERREVDRLRSVQNALAPAEQPNLPLLEIGTSYVPAEAGVAGDFYLVTEGLNNSTVIALGDVAGKGMTAAKRATFVRATLTACSPFTDDPVYLLRTVNAELARQYGFAAEFITMLCVVVKPDGRLVWSTAGHPPPVSLADGQPIGDQQPAFPLGIAPDVPATPSETALPDAGLLLYTDGLLDARPPGGRYETLGSRRLARIISELPDLSPQEAVDRLTRMAETFARGALPDDLCLVALRSRLPHHAWREGESQPESAWSPPQGPRP
jgi:serine phosphatase RsbU (regulator of sigma subunit)